MFWKLSAAPRAAAVAGPTYRPETPLLVKTPAVASPTDDSPRPQRPSRRHEQVGKAGPHPQLELALE